MKGKTMADKNNGWEKPEEKFPETEFEDSFAGFFSEEEEIKASGKRKKRRKNKNGPDILAVSEGTDEGFVIEEVVALDTGKEVVTIKEETTEERIVDAMLTLYDAPRDVIERDVKRVIDTLRSINALE